MVRRIRHCPRVAHRPSNRDADRVAKSDRPSTRSRLHPAHFEPARHYFHDVLGLSSDVLAMSSAEVPVLG